jgi:Amt family ammonium transporter
MRLKVPPYQGFHCRAACRKGEPKHRADRLGCAVTGEAQEIVRVFGIGGALEQIWECNMARRLFSLVVFLVGFLAMPAAAGAVPDKFALQDDVDHVWTITAAALVFFMQAGFLLLEAGSVRSKNSVNVAQKNLMDFVLSTVCFGALGYMLMFGNSVGGWIGWQPDLLLFGSAGDWSLTFFVFQLMFCGTAATVMSGAVAERMTINGYLLGALLIATVIYPVAGHWAWGGLLNGSEEPLLARYGFMDFAGSSVVHSVGAWVALAAIIIIGPRIGKFDENGNPRRLHGHSPVLATVGAMILWVGWIGFNGGSLLSGTGDFASVIVNTVVAGGAGGATLMIIGRVNSGLFKPDATINGLLGGLVAITASADVMTPQLSFVVGVLGAVVVHVGTYLLESVWKLDDPLGAIPVHGFAGTFGTLVLAFLAPAETLAAGSRLGQFGIQLGGAVLFFLWSFGLAYLVFRTVDTVLKSFSDGGNGLRVSDIYEKEGLNLHEHDAPMGSGILQEAMARVARDHGGKLERIELDYGDEAYETSVLYNRIMDNIAAERTAEETNYQQQKARRLEVEAEVAGVVQACANGDFSKRLKTEGRKDFVLELCTGINALCDTVESAMGAVENSLNAVSIGDLSQKITGHYGGQLADIQAAMNSTLDRLSETVGDVQQSVSAAGMGNFQLRVNIEGKEGFFRDLCLSVNDLCDISERGLCELLETLTHFGDGDLTVKMSDQYRGRFAEISSAVERMSHGISDLLASVQDSAMDVVTDGQSIADDGSRVVEQSKRQVEALENVTSSIRTLLETARSSAEQAEQSSDLCKSANEHTANGQLLATQLSEQIADINRSTDEIIAALVLIEDISMQTNLLSLNASVEAVRGGGSGPGSAEGFKVVAQEIRSLANKSSDAANNIRELTTRVRASVAAGVDLVEQTNQALTHINDAISQSTHRANSLSSTSARQLTLCKGIESEASSLFNGAESNLKLARHSSATSTALVASAERTMDNLSHFEFVGRVERKAA